MPEVIDPAAMDEIKSSIAEAKRGIEEMRKGLVDQETVERMIRDASERSRSAKTRGEAGFEVESEDDAPSKMRALKGRDRLEAIHTRDARKVASELRVSQGDVVEFQRCADRLLILAAAVNADPRDLAYYTEEFLPTVRAMDTATAGEGLEWVPTQLSSDLIGRVTLQLQVAGLFPSFTQATPTFEFPATSVGRQRLGIAAQQTADTGQTKFVAVTPGTRKVQFVAKKFAGEVLVSKETEEDAILPVLKWIEDEIVDYLAADIEDTLINGDTAAAQDTGLGASDPRRNWDGLRKLTQAGAKTDGGNAAITVALLRSARKKMGKYGVRPGDLAAIMGLNSYFNLLSDANVLTVDKYGANATVLSGELGKVDGMPVIVSEYVRQDMNATGVFDNVTTNRSHALIANRKSFLRGVRREVTVQRLVELYAESDQDAVIASTRQSFNGLYGTELAVANLYNLAA